MKTKIENLDLTNLSDLNNIALINNCSNYINLPKIFIKSPGYNKFIEDYSKGLLQFVNDFEEFSENKENILVSLSKLLNVESLYFCFCFDSAHIELPLSNYMLLYKKKDSSSFISIYENGDLIFYDMENEINISKSTAQNIIDFEYKYTYILKFQRKNRKRKNIDNDNDILKENNNDTSLKSLS